MSSNKNKQGLENLVNLEQIFFKCMENAKAVLTRWLKMDIQLKLSEVVSMPFYQVPNLVGNIDEVIIAVLSRIMGELEASQLFIFPRKDASILVNLALNRELNEMVRWNELECSVMEETSNIIGSAFVNVLVEETKIKAVYEPPVFGKDMLGSIMQSVLVKHISGNDEALLVKGDFLVKDLYKVLKRPLKIFFFILPDREYFRYIKDELRGKKCQN
jgi:chemotaxis protein CheY-P-specific phosphatase CheC